jgi:hypothetical protein
MHRLRRGPSFVAVAIPVLFALLGMIVFLVPLTALLLALRRYEGFSARLVAAYYVWVLYDLAWAYELWRLNGA